MMTATVCPSTDQLRALTLGQLPEDRSEELFDHVRTCAGCRSEMDTVQDAEDSLISSLRQPLHPDNYGQEPACQLATARALGALARIANEPGELSWDQFPQSIGEYELVRPLGRGGMGVVFLARHTKLGREVAVKLLADERLGGSRVKERFDAEMQAIGRLSHPNIVTAHDARDVDGTAVLVTEFIDGFDLGELVRRVGPLSVADACEIIRQVAVALQYVHEQGYVHRDVKPSNIMLSRDGQVKLLDLGLARLRADAARPTDDSAQPEITGTGQIMGTADYVAPEQVTDSRDVDIRADIYSLGCSLFKLLTGQAPFADGQHLTAFAKMTAHVSVPPPQLSTTLPAAPATLAKLVNAMLTKAPAARPQTPREVAERLSEYCASANLSDLVHTADSATDATDQLLTTNRPTATTDGTHGGRSSLFYAVACGILGVCLGACLGIIITIINSDGSRTSINVADGAQLGIQTSASDAGDAMGAVPAPDAFAGDRLAFAILMNPESERTPNVSAAGIEHLRHQLHRYPVGTFVGDETSRWYPVQDQVDVPIDAWNNGQHFALASVDPRFSVSWKDIRDHIISANAIVDAPQPRLELELDQLLAARMKTISQSNIRNRLGIIVNGQIVMTPHINSAIGNKVAITGSFTREQLMELAAACSPDGEESPRVPDRDDVPETSNRIQPGFSPMSFRVLVDKLSSEELTRARDELNRVMVDSDVVRVVPTPSGTWYPMGDFEWSVPIEAKVAGVRYCLVTNEDSGILPWTELFTNLGCNVSSSRKQKAIRIQFSFRPKLGEQLVQLAKDHLGQQLSFILDDTVLAAPVIRTSEIRGWELQVEADSDLQRYFDECLSGHPVTPLDPDRKRIVREPQLPKEGETVSPASAVTDED